MEEEKKEILEENKKQKVKSVSEFISRVSEIRKERNEKSIKKKDNTVLYFRGQRDVKWKLEPSIVREGLAKKESYLLRVTLSRCSSYFQELTNNFDLLTKLQHYGLPTRLLDVTTNPLVALYFACYSPKNTEKVDGVVYFGENICNYATDIEVQILSFLAFYFEDMKSDRDCIELLQNKIFYSSEQIKKYIENDYEKLSDLFKKNLLVQPNYNNERINRQSGMFILPSLFEFGWISKQKKIKQNNVDKYIEDKEYKIYRKDCSLSDYFKNKILIDKDKKKEILEELDLYNINEASLFPELEHQISYLKNIVNNPSYSNNKIILAQNNKSLTNAISSMHGAINNSVALGNVMSNFNTIQKAFELSDSINSLNNLRKLNDIFETSNMASNLNSLMTMNNPILKTKK